MSDEQAIQAVVHLYVDGMTFANAPALKKAFHPDAAIIGNYLGSVEWLSRDAFIAGVVAEGPAAPDTKPLMDIDLIDISGDAASVKVTDEFAGATQLQPQRIGLLDELVHLVGGEGLPQRLVAVDQQHVLHDRLRVPVPPWASSP